MNGTIITNKGLQLIARLVASGTELAFTRAAIGIGSVPQGYDLGSMIGLNQYIMDGVISSCSATGDEASIVFQISSIGVAEGFTMTEAGLFAQDPDEGEILYAYLDMASDPQYIYPENNAISKFVEFTLVVKVGRVSSITAYINPSALVTREELDEELKKKVDINGGDIADTIVEEFGTEENSFPVPDAGDTTKTLWGKIKKFAEDFRNWYKGVCLIGSIVNNCTSTATNLPLAAGQGKVLMDLYTQLNSNIGILNGRLGPTFTVLRYTSVGDDIVMDVHCGIYLMCIFSRYAELCGNIGSYWIISGQDHGASAYKIIGVDSFDVTPSAVDSTNFRVSISDIGNPTHKTAWACRIY